MVLWAWPVQRLTRGGLGPVAGWELFLGHVGSHRQEGRRRSMPMGEALAAWMAWLFRVTASLDGFLIPPWAVRSHDQGKAYLRWREDEGTGVPRPWRERLVVPVHPAGFVAEISQEMGAAGVRRAAEGEPYLHQRAVERLRLTERDLVLASPLPDAAQMAWVRQVAALGAGRVPVVARAVSSRALLSRLAQAGVAYATGKAVWAPLSAPVEPQGPLLSLRD